MEVCDRVTSDVNGPKEAIQSIIKRLAHRNANVQLYTLELANAVSQNCDKALHRELASRAFTDALLRLSNDRTTHTQVKSKVFERMEEWSAMFENDGDLGIMHDAYIRLKQSNPSIHPPSAPLKNSLTDLDRRKEEEELQMALSLSLQEEERKKSTISPDIKGKTPSSTTRETESVGMAGNGNNATADTQQQSATKPTEFPMPGPIPSGGTTAATVSRVRALYDFLPAEQSELEFKKGDVIAVLESVYKDWWRGSLKGRTGIFPLNYVEKLSDPTHEELHREAMMEAEVFSEIKNVEKLLTLLSTCGSSGAGFKEEDNEEISKLYHHTLAIRPKLIKLIEKYTQKKDDFTQLNEKFIKARRDYESLLDMSMSHPQQPTYHYSTRVGLSGPHHEPSGGSSRPADLDGRTHHNLDQSGQSVSVPAQHDPSFTMGPTTSEMAFTTLSHNNSRAQDFAKPPQSSPAPFYLAGAEVPSHGGPPQMHNLGYHPHQPAASGVSGPTVSQKHDLSAVATPSLGQPKQVYSGDSYTQQMNASHPHGLLPGQRPFTTYGAQELATSSYDSPIIQQGLQDGMSATEPTHNGGSGDNRQNSFITPALTDLNPHDPSSDR
jgi:signal transducing adaptor molecule